MPILPFITPDLLMSDNVAVVGSSDNLRWSNFGKEIDDFTDVIRFNQAPTDGYESDVGSKTTLRVMGNGLLFGVTYAEFTLSLTNTRICHGGNGDWEERAYPCLDPSNEFFFFHYNQLASVAPTLDLPLPPSPAHVLSSGLRTVYALVAAGIVPHLFGFETKSGIHWHYWSDERAHEHGVHDFASEARMLLYLAKAGKVVLHQAFRETTRLFDCTLRDGGYQNNWAFSTPLVDDYLQTMAALPIDYVEIGFRDPKLEIGCGNAIDAFLRTLQIPRGLKLGVMVNAADLLKHPQGVIPALESMFAPAEASPISLVRLACHVTEIVPVLPAIAWLKDKGYRTAMNFMQISDRSAAEIASIVSLVSNQPLDVLYFADSLGGLDPDRVAEIIQAFRVHWKGELGIHTHDNRGLALANSLRAVREGVNWIDGTIMGMGRGPGNAKTEHLIIELFPQTDLHDLLTLIGAHFKPLLDKHRWGCNPFYHLAGKRSIHPTYVQEMLEAGCPTDILKALDQLAGTPKFDRSRLPK